MDKVRIDKWLWSVRLFKTRTQAADALKEGKIRMDNEPLKPSFMITKGVTITIRKEGFLMTYKCVDLIEKRVSAPLAQVCYEDLTPESELNKYKSWFIVEGAAERRDKGAGRPTKKDRREIDRFKLD